ncbi:MAG: hypothetical protein Q7W45_02570 [Bacteroidota bacterium]|nr:hypothetical protein [Bacteroidota bacterium]MDP3145863.1 hypothetical protein [Bacteroidota bacterium]MDP3558497.1 hypothetical protein [Bacteroidota bacterium]
MSTGKLILLRKKNFNGLAVAIDVFINDQPQGKMVSGEKKEFDLEPGSYKIKVQQNVKSGEQTVIIYPGKTISYSYFPSLLSIVSFLSPLLGLGLLFLFKIPIIIAGLILLPGAIVSIYLLSSGRSKYFLFKAIH